MASINIEMIGYWFPGLGASSFSLWFSPCVVSCFISTLGESVLGCDSAGVAFLDLQAMKPRKAIATMIFFMIVCFKVNEWWSLVYTGYK